MSLPLVLTDAPDMGLAILGSVIALMDMREQIVLKVSGHWNVS